MQICWVSNLQTFTAKIYYTVFLICAAQLALAQFTDDFSDNNFSASPSWNGDDSHFVVVDHQLKLEAPPGDGVSFLSTPSAIEGNASWEFNLKLEFNPSASNYCKVYLMSDQPDLTNPLNGYFVMIGDSKDEVSLYKQEGIILSKIIDGRDGILDLSSIDMRIRVLYNEAGEWQLFTKLGITGDYFMEGSGAASNTSTSTYFGILCAYTATRSDKFFFDDFNIQGSEVPDDTPPMLMSFEIKSSQELRLTFSEPLDPGPATTPENYTVSPIVGHPLAVTLSSDRKTVLLRFETTFSNDGPSVVTITGLTDTSGNVMATLGREFLFTLPVKPDPKSVVITEIFADPSPVVGLPESEFVEIHNRTDQTFNLSGWTFTDLSAIATLPDFTLLPQAYVVLTAENSTLIPSTDVLRLRGFPSLNNSSDVLILRDSINNIVDSVNYSDSWYRDDEKRSGGWSLEIIDPDNLCGGGENWAGSENDSGGTPGAQNSLFANKPDLRGPKLISAVPVSSVEIQLQFDERLEKPLTDDLTFKIDPFLTAREASFSNAALTQLNLSLAAEIQGGTPYSITVENLYDCAGNIIAKDDAQASFGLPEQADSLDILINEILFNPRPTGVDFVEIVNTSGKYFNLKNWALASLEEGILINKEPLSENNYLLKPGEILAVTKDSDILMGEYITTRERHLLQVTDLPPFNDDAGSVALVDPNGKVTDYFAYTKDMHSAFIKDDEGVSLERISFDATSTSQNWKSASSTVGFATPGYANSNAFPEVTASAVMHVEPEIFDPLGGQNNFALIHYNFENGGQVANVKVFDSQGRLTKEIANNDLVGTKGFYRWDGDRNDGTKAAIGYYMIWFEVFDDMGGVRNFRLPVAVAGKF